jgi:ABC-type multidrug transport system ATPase subunit
MLATLLRPDAGFARVCGADIISAADRVRELIGLTGQYAAVDEDLTGFENLLLIGRLLEVWAMIRALVAEGTTVLLTTQYLDEADRLANQIAVTELALRLASLNEVFMALTGHATEEGGR